MGRGHAAMRSGDRLATLMAYLRLPHAAPIVAVMATTAALSFVIAGWDASWTRRTLMLLAMLGAQVVIGVVNELVDADTDAAVRPDKPLPSGRVTRRGAMAMLVAGATAMVLAAAPLGLAAWALCLLGCGLGVAYSVWFKPTVLAWLPYLLALPLLPIWVAVVHDRFRPALLVLYPLGACAVLAVHLAQAVPDVAADRAAGIDSLTTRLGEARTLALCWGACALSAVAAVAAGRAFAVEMWPLWAALVVVCALLAGQIVLYRGRGRAGILATFPATAACVALLGIAWVYATGT